MKKEFPSTPDEVFEAAIEGAYFSKQMAALRKLKRIGSFPFDPALPVNTFWDLGMNDMMAIWLHQFDGSVHRFIGYYENNNEGWAHYINWLKEWADLRGLVFGEHYGPHDLEVRELSGGDEGRPMVRRERAESMGLKFKVVPRVGNLMDAVEASRQALPKCAFDEVECAVGIKHLSNYRKEFDATLGVFKNYPHHDEASHGASAFHTFSRGWRDPTPKRKRKKGAAGNGGWMG